VAALRRSSADPDTARFHDLGETVRVPVRTWAADWEHRRAGVACVMCAEGRPDLDDAGNRRFFAGADTDACLHRGAPQPGYATVRWRGRHVPDVSEMTEDELSRFWREIAIVGRAMTEVFQPCHLNYDLLGNLVPHVHVHIVSRFVDDPCPNAPLKPWVLHPIDDGHLLHQVQRLRAVLRST